MLTIIHNGKNKNKQIRTINRSDNIILIRKCIQFIYTFFLQPYRVVILYLLQNIIYNNYIYKYDQENLILKLYIYIYIKCKMC